MSQEELDRLESHPLIERFARALVERPGREIHTEPPTRLAAILLVLREGDGGEPELLLIKRADADGDPWSGHIACPGGRMEASDRDLEVTAVRETREETGIDVAHEGRVLGHLDDLRPRSSFLPPIVIRPYVALVRAGVRILASREVASAFWVPLSALREQRAWSLGSVQAHGTARHVSIFQHGEHTVWGLTERALRQFLTYVGEPPAGESVDQVR